MFNVIKQCNSLFQKRTINNDFSESFLLVTQKSKRFLHGTYSLVYTPGRRFVFVEVYNYQSKIILGGPSQ